MTEGEQDPSPALTAASQAVYRCFGEDGQLLYVGTTGNLGRRLAAHAQKIWFLEVRGITLEWYSDEVSALAVERRVICVEQPKYNVMHKSDRHRPRPVSLAPRRPSRTAVVIPFASTGARRAIFAKLLQEAPEFGVSPSGLMAESGFRSSLVYQLLAALVRTGAVRHLGRGRYCAVPGIDVASALDRYYAERGAQ